MLEIILDQARLHALPILLVSAFAAVGLLIQYFVFKPLILKIAKDQEVGDNAIKIVFIGLSLYIFQPAIEEIVFRAPLLLFFTDMNTPGAWITLSVSSLIFGFLHMIGFEKQLTANVLDKIDEDTRVCYINPKVATVLKVIVTTMLGFGLGYLVISKQNLWYSVIGHYIWNFLWPVIIMGGVVLLTLILRKIGEIKYKIQIRKANNSFKRFLRQRGDHMYKDGWY